MLNASWNERIPSIHITSSLFRAWIYYTRSPIGPKLSYFEIGFKTKVCSAIDGVIRTKFSVFDREPRRRFGRWRQRRDTRWLLGGPGHTVWLRTWSIAFWRPALIRPADRGLLQQSICLQCWAAIKMFLPIKSTRLWNRAGEMLLYYSLDIVCVHGYLDASHVTFRGEIH